MKERPKTISFFLTYHKLPFKNSAAVKCCRLLLFNPNQSHLIKITKYCFGPPLPIRSSGLKIAEKYISRVMGGEK
jgi:hypothetical protein